ncbi:alpha/beta fold hydrolase [Paraneptunicella aestuarii]|uniref:alpha/beta fold hydrolase n=1 Tax=Paraneptunicella aestuarii TaxID=2831148 RepID=UPI001E39CA06|nr:alpha/beta fold hydrolase [Paraneptunicella aestuarii]UAA38672.1 alpha/beta fold hydrolase [Paraneptunicella aestuarii]
MSQFVPWDSQPLDEWAEKYAKGKFVELGGRQTHYLEKGDGKEGAAPVILLHGFFYDSYMWHENIDALAAEHKVYALDLWGFGYSTREPLDYGYPLYEEQVLRFMDKMGIDKATLVGQSMGGGTSILFALNHPQRIHKLVLVDAAGLPNKLPAASKLVNMPGVGKFLMGLKTDSLRRKSLGDFFVHNKHLITDEYFQNVTRFHKVAGTTDVLLGIQRREFFDKLSDEIHHLGDLFLPTLIIWGKQDRGVPFTRGEEMNTILRGSKLVILDKAGHVPNYDQAEQFNQVVLDFLRTENESRAAKASELEVTN